MFQVKTQQYSGPLEKLLELIEAKQLPIATISLADVTADFIDYIKSLELRVDQKILADFIAVAARLMLIKSKALLPSFELTAEEESGIRDLETRLLLYREFKAAGAALRKNFTGGFSFSREYLHGGEQLFYPPSRLTTQTLAAVMAKVIGAIEFAAPSVEKTVARGLISIEEKMQELLERMSGKNSASFASLAQGRARGEVIVLFLALLHLLKQQRISGAQGDTFGDIIIQSQSTRF